MVTESEQTVTGPKTWVFQDWFDEKNEEINKFLIDRCNAFEELQNDETSQSKKDHFNYLKSKAQRELQQIQDSWWNNKANKVQQFANSNNFKEFFSFLKAVFSHSCPITPPFLSSDSITLPKDRESITEQWMEHFSNLLNRPSTVVPTALELIP